jgi:FtsP/CotA-like multicopper oxidase with cupredoxin domain
MSFDRREFLKLGSAAALGSTALRVAGAAATSAPAASAAAAADYTVRIATGLIELSSERIVSTTLYNGQFPGPLLRFKEGQRVVIDIMNSTDTPELVRTPRAQPPLLTYK